MKLWTASQVAERLGVSSAWVLDHISRRKPTIPHIRLDGLVRFIPEDIEKFIQQWRTV